MSAVRLQLCRQVLCSVAVACSPLLAQAQALQSLISSALAFHPSAQVQRALLDAAQAGVQTARWQFYPTPSLAIEHESDNAALKAAQGDQTVSTLRLQQPLWTGGRLSAGLQKALAGIEVSRAALAEVNQQLALRVLQAYGEWLSAHLKTRAYAQSSATHERLREQVQRRIEQGASAQSDLILAVSRQQSLASEISVARAQQDIALARLGQLLGQPIDERRLSAMLTAPQALSAGLELLLEQAQALSPAAHKALAQAQVQQTVIDERRSELSPEVYLRLERQYGNSLVPQTAPQTRAFVGLSSRFGAGLSSLSNVQGARAQYEAALAQVQLERSAVAEQVLADHALAASARTRQAALEASLTAAVQVSESYDRQFLAGRKTWLDVMNAARELTQTEIQLADLQSAQVVVTWRLAIYTQGLAAVLTPGA